MDIDRELLLSLDLPVPPSANHIWRTSVTGTYKTDDAKIFEQEVWAAVVQARGGHDLRLTDAQYFALDYDLSFGLGQSGNGRRDVDNALKSLTDGICRALGLNDNRVLAISIQKSLGEAPFCQARLYRLASPLPRRWRPPDQETDSPSPAQRDRLPRRAASAPAP
jgi:Holliday junction resolvase RusA-like endonuclease